VFKGIVLRHLFLVVSLLAFCQFFTGCDFSSMSDLKRAEKELKKADDINAEHWAEKEYKRAQKYLDLAVDLNHENKINEARDAALEARDWAREAIKLSIKRAEELEKEHESVKRKDF